MTVFLGCVFIIMVQLFLFFRYSDSLIVRPKKLVVYVSVSVFVFFVLSAPACVSVYLFVRLPFCLSNFTILSFFKHASVFIRTHVSVCLSVSMFLSLFQPLPLSLSLFLPLTLSSTWHCICVSVSIDLCLHPCQYLCQYLCRCLSFLFLDCLWHYFCLSFYLCLSVYACLCVSVWVPVSLFVYS